MESLECRPQHRVIALQHIYRTPGHTTLTYRTNPTYSALAFIGSTGTLDKLF